MGICMSTGLIDGSGSFNQAKRVVLKHTRHAITRSVQVVKQRSCLQACLACHNTAELRSNYVISVASNTFNVL